MLGANLVGWDSAGGEKEVTGGGDVYVVVRSLSPV